jgi:hypothetical protein
MSEANCSLTEVVKLGVVVGKATGTHPAAARRRFSGSDGPRDSRAPAVCRWRPVVKPNVLRMADAVMHAATPAVENGPPLLVGGHQEQAGEAAAEFLECGLLSPVSLSSIARVHLFALYIFRSGIASLANRCRNASDRVRFQTTLVSVSSCAYRSGTTHTHSGMSQRLDP